MHLILIPSPLFLKLAIDKNEIQMISYSMIINNVDNKRHDSQAILCIAS